MPHFKPMKKYSEFKHFKHVDIHDLKLLPLSRQKFRHEQASAKWNALAFDAVDELNKRIESVQLKRVASNFNSSNASENSCSVSEQSSSSDSSFPSSIASISPSHSSEEDENELPRFSPEREDASEKKKANKMKQNEKEAKLIVLGDDDEEDDNEEFENGEKENEDFEEKPKKKKSKHRRKRKEKRKKKELEAAHDHAEEESDNENEEESEFNCRKRLFQSFLIQNKYVDNDSANKTKRKCLEKIQRKRNRKEFHLHEDRTLLEKQFYLSKRSKFQ